jgi:hypothetical protein
MIGIAAGNAKSKPREREGKADGSPPRGNGDILLAAWRSAEDHRGRALAPDFGD